MENPTRQSWQDIVAVIQSCDEFRKVDRMPLRQWIDLACAHNGPLEMLRLFFVDHFECLSGGGIVLDMKNACGASPTLASTGAVTMKTIRLYVERAIHGQK